MTRIELTEAAERLRSTLDTITNDLGRFHLKVRQRSNDVTAELLTNGAKVLADVGQQATLAMSRLVTSTERAHHDMLTTTTTLTQRLIEVSAEAVGAAGRLAPSSPRRQPSRAEWTRWPQCWNKWQLRRSAPPYLSAT